MNPKKQFNSQNYRLLVAFTWVVTFSSEKLLKFRNIQFNMEEI